MSVQPYKDFCNCLEELCTSYSSQKIIVCGDFNLQQICWIPVSAQYSPLGTVHPRVIEATNVLQDTAVLMDFVQLYPPHRAKGYTLDLLFSPATLCEYIPGEEEILHADPVHHECAYFKIKNFATRVSYSVSENAPAKNYYRANFEIIIDLLDIDWERILEPGEINHSVEIFYDKLNYVVEQNVPNLPSSSTHFPPWFNSELKHLTCEKKQLHASYKESLRLQLPTQASDYRDFQRVRSIYLQLSRRLYLQYIESTEGKIKSHVKSFWSYVHRFTKGNTIPSSMYLRDRSAQCRRSVCDLLADHFSSVYTSSLLSDIEPTELDELISLKVEEIEVALALAKLDDNVKSGPDGVPLLFEAMQIESF